MSSTQAKERRNFGEFCTSIDDLGPEIILNLKKLKTYRYKQEGAFLYFDLLKSILLKHRWMNRFKVRHNYEPSIN